VSPDLFPAAWLAHWPGTTAYVCDTHKQQLENLARTMGWDLQCEPCPDTIETCKNCVNEAMK